MEGLLIVLIGLLVGVTTYLVRYYLAVKSLSKQIEEKLVEESHRRITLKNQPKSLVTLTNDLSLARDFKTVWVYRDIFDLIDVISRTTSLSVFT